MNKKIMQFIEANFPPYNNCTIIKEEEDKTVAVLDYGSDNKMRITVGHIDDGYNLYRLLQTDFI